MLSSNVRGQTLLHSAERTADKRLEIFCEIRWGLLIHIFSQSISKQRIALMITGCEQIDGFSDGDIQHDSFLAVEIDFMYGFS